MKSSLSRPKATRKYKSVYYIIPEGRRTEPDYFDIIRELIPEKLSIAVSCKCPSNSSLSAIIAKAKEVTSNNRHPDDKIWCVLDMDDRSHTQEQFDALAKWKEKSYRNYFAISTPRIEYWLLAHFEENPSEKNAKDELYITRYLPGYGRSKGVSQYSHSFTRARVLHAIDVAKTAETRKDPLVGSGLWRLVAELLLGKSCASPLVD